MFQSALNKSFEGVKISSFLSPELTVKPKYLCFMPQMTLSLRSFCLDCLWIQFISTYTQLPWVPRARKDPHSETQAQAREGVDAIPIWQWITKTFLLWTLQQAKGVWPSALGQQLQNIPPCPSRNLKYIKTVSTSLGKLVLSAVSQPRLVNAMFPSGRWQKTTALVQTKSSSHWALSL